MKVVLNTSPIIFLGKIDCLKVLTECFSEIYVPQGVIDELQDYPLPVNMQIRNISSEGAAYFRGVLGRLHQGELEAIILAQELFADYVILDDLLARRKAQRLGMNIMGTMGVLLLLKKRGLFSAETTWLKK